MSFAFALSTKLPMSENKNLLNFASFFFLFAFHLCPKKIYVYVQECVFEHIRETRIGIYILIKCHDFILCELKKHFWPSWIPKCVWNLSDVSNKKKWENVCFVSHEASIFFCVRIIHFGRLYFGLFTLFSFWFHANMLEMEANAQNETNRMIEEKKKSEKK